METWSSKTFENREITWKILIKSNKNIKKLRKWKIFGRKNWKRQNNFNKIIKGQNYLNKTEKDKITENNSEVDEDTWRNIEKPKLV